MKITIKKANRAEIMALREQLVAALDQETTSSAELERLNERHQKLQAEITALESATDSESEDSASKLATKRIQLEQVSKKISQISNIDGASVMAWQGNVSNLLRQFARAAAAATGPDIEIFAQEIAVKIRPFCQDDATARHLAFQTPSAKFLTQTYTRAFGSFGFSVLEIKSAIARADEILSGELNWTWDAKQ
jgi:uncharacterized protein YdcH (DUF465 family)